MTKSEATAEVFMTAFKALPKSERDAVLVRIARDKTLARDLLEENRIRLEVGAMARLEVLQAETGVAQREEEVIVARRLIEDADDNLKRILNLPKDTQEWQVRIKPTDKPEVVEKDIDLLL